ncbi:hypothetical protein [Wolbachia endosymbiont (group A) of Beris morrisii]|uniref:hypothetical protein n=1 Tax=Wolbachia endosymbiont (group A) of Beris morrisii TaxID=3066139 RepID=UPI003340DB4E
MRELINCKIERRKRNGNDSDLKKALEERLAVMAPSDSESEQSSWTSNEDGHEQIEPEQEKEEQTKHTNSPSSKEEGSGGLDSGIGSRAASPSYSEQKTEEPPSSCVDSPSAAQVKSVNPVDNKVQDSSIPPIEDHAKFSASKGGVPRSS